MSQPNSNQVFRLLPMGGAKSETNGCLGAMIEEDLTPFMD